MAGRGRPFPKGSPGKPKGAKDRFPRGIRERCRVFLESEPYLTAAKLRVQHGRAPGLELAWHYYAFDKPTEHQAVTGTLKAVSRIVHEHHSS